MKSKQFAKSTLLMVLLFTFTLAQSQSQHKVENIFFESEGAKLAGSIVLPRQQEIKAAMVFVHGSGEQTRSLYWAERFANLGIASLVYDKRGVGESEGKYESKYSVGEANLTLLAKDALAAFERLSQHNELKNVPLGMSGISQAGWIVPLSAVEAKQLDFIVERTKVSLQYKAIAL